MNSDTSACFGDCPKPKKSKPSVESHTAATYWAHLPSIVIHEIFDILDAKDRQNASSVCKNWRQNVFHPKWWPEATFKIEPCNIDKAKFYTTVFGRIVTSAKIKVNTLTPECTDEFILLLEALSENNNLKELIIEPTHCHFYMSKCWNKTSCNMQNVIATLKRCLPNLVKFSIGCIEVFAHDVYEYLTILAMQQPEKITVLGLASAKDNLNEYEDYYFECDLIKPFTNLKVLSIDFEQLSDKFLRSLDGSKSLKRLIVQLHGVRDDHPGTTNSAWADFNDKHPKCELRLTVIHCFEEIKVLHKVVLRGQMPLTHLKVFFCENVNMRVLEYLSSNYAHTLRSLMWVDSLSNGKPSWAFFTANYDTSPDPLIMISWLCKKLEELVLYGYKYSEDNVIAIARLCGDKLKNFEVAQDDIVGHASPSPYENCLIDVPIHLRRSWTPTKSANLHPVILNPTAGDSDEYFLPIILNDLH